MILIVGHSQHRDRAGDPPLKGPTGARLFQLANRPDLRQWSRYSWEESWTTLQLAPYASAVNFFDIPADDDIERLVVLKRALPILAEWERTATAGLAGSGVYIVALGRKVASRLGLNHSHYLKMGRAPAGYECLAGACYVPHPSGSNRWWNDPNHMKAGARFLRNVFQPTFQPEPIGRASQETHA